MSLTTREQIVAQCPYRATEEELLTLMKKLGDYGEWESFGERRFALIMQLHKAAVTRGIGIPGEFAIHIQNIQSYGAVSAITGV